MATFYRQTYKLKIKARASLPEKQKKKGIFNTGDREMILKTVETKPDPKYNKVKKWAEDILQHGEQVSELALVEIEEFTQ